MPRVFVGIGSNINRKANISLGLTALRSEFGELMRSPVYDTQALGFNGDNFYNLVVSFQTNLPVTEVSHRLTEIENRYQHSQTNKAKFRSRSLDLDLLLYGDLILEAGEFKLPRSDVYERAYVLKPLLDLCPDLQDPVSGKAFSEIWNTLQHKQDTSKILEQVVLSDVE